MAKITATLKGDFQTIVEDLENTVVEGSFSASLEGKTANASSKTAFPFMSACLSGTVIRVATVSA